MSVLDRVINVELIKNPANWIIVALMVLMAGLVLTCLQPSLGFQES